MSEQRRALLEWYLGCVAAGVWVVVAHLALGLSNVQVLALAAVMSLPTGRLWSRMEAARE